MDITPENILENDLNNNLIYKYGIIQNIKQNEYNCLKH